MTYSQGMIPRGERTGVSSRTSFPVRWHPGSPQLPCPLQTWSFQLPGTSGGVPPLRSCPGISPAWGGGWAPSPRPGTALPPVTVWWEQWKGEESQDPIFGDHVHWISLALHCIRKQTNRLYMCTYANHICLCMQHRISQCKLYMHVIQSRTLTWV